MAELYNNFFHIHTLHGERVPRQDILLITLGHSFFSVHRRGIRVILNGSKIKKIYNINHSI
jgi:hypothetical protein